MVFDFVQFQAITQVSQLLLIALLTIKNINFSVCFANYVTINLNKQIKVPQLLLLVGLTLKVLNFSYVLQTM
jgi:hypothetical protein